MNESELRVFQELSQAVNSNLDLKELLDRIVRIILGTFSAELGAVLLTGPQPGVLSVGAAIGVDSKSAGLTRVVPGMGYIGRVLSSGESQLADDVDEIANHVEAPIGIRSQMIVPLKWEQETIGVLIVGSSRNKAFSREKLELLGLFALQISNAVHRDKLITQFGQRSRQLEKSTRETALLERLGRQMNSNLSIDSLLQEVLHLANKAFHFEHCAVLLKELDSQGEFLVVRAALDFGEYVDSGKRIASGQGITGRVAKTGEPVLVPDVKMNGGYIDGLVGGRCEMAVPLIVRGEVIGVLDAEATEPQAFQEDDLHLFSIFASWAGTALHNADLYSQLERKNTQLDQNMTELNRMNQDLKKYAECMETANQELEKRVRELTTLQEASRAITSSLNLNDTLRAIVHMTREIIKSSSCAIRLLDDETEEMKSLHIEESDPPDPSEGVAPKEEYGTGRSLKSFVGVPLKIGNRIIGYFELGSLDEGAFGDEERRVLHVLAGQAAIAIENARLFESTQQTYYETIRSLAQALEARDAYTKGHSERVTQYALKMAEVMGLGAPSRKVIQYAGLLHDIGKIGISDSVLNKRRSLSSDDWTAIHNHPLFGDSILEPLQFLENAQKIVLHHHEHYDGSGYPAHMQGDEIPLEARIIAVADAYDAMTSDRPYRKALPHAQAIEELQNSSGKQFDPKVVQAFLAVISTNQG